MKLPKVKITKEGLLTLLSVVTIILKGGADLVDVLKKKDKDNGKHSD